MDLNQLHFSPQQLSDLYEQHITLADGVQQPVVKEAVPLSAAAAQPTIAYKGKNKKGVLWIVHEPAQAYLTDEDFEFLSQIIAACKMNMEDVALINTAPAHLMVDAITSQLNAGLVLCCGVPSTLLPFNMTEYILYPHQKRNYFVCDSLGDMRSDKVKKSKLWLALKEHLAI